MASSFSERPHSDGHHRIDHCALKRRLPGQPRRHAGVDCADARPRRAYPRRLRRGQGSLSQARAIAAARTRGAGARSRFALHRAVDARRLHVRRIRRRQEHPGRRARAIAAARARGAGARFRLALHRADDVSGLHVRRIRCRQEHPGRRCDRRHRICVRGSVYGQRQRFRHRCRRAATVRPRQDAAGAGTGARK